MSTQRCAYECSQRHYSWQPRSRNNPNIHPTGRWIKETKNCGVAILYSFLLPNSIPDYWYKPSPNESYAKQKKPDLKSHILNDAIYMSFLKQKLEGLGLKSMVANSRGQKRGWLQRGYTDFMKWIMKPFCILSMMMDAKNPIHILESIDLPTHERIILLQDGFKNKIIFPKLTSFELSLGTLKMGLLDQKLFGR